MSIQQFFNKISETIQRQQVKPYLERLQQVQAISLETWDNEQIRERSLALRCEIQAGASADDILIEAYALAAEAVRRVMGIQLFDVQIIAGIALHEGRLVEMHTGEGKTLAAVLPAYLHALQGKGVHVLTFNDYLACRDAEWMGPAYQFLGVTVGYIQADMNIADRQAAYAADITYVTAKEAGFDYLKDSISYNKDELVQRPFYFAITDEADSILIDEARVPLVIAGEAEASEMDFKRMAAIVRHLSSGSDYEPDEYKRNVYLTEAGIDKAEAILSCGNLYADENIETLTMLNCALHAEALLKRDVDYIVRNGRVELIDEFTGRIAKNRHWPDGLQAAVEAKEGLTIRAGGRILGMITLQHLLSLYPTICGMTATALTSADEFRETYHLDVVAIPPNRPCRRIDHPHLVFTHQEAKINAVVREVVTVHKTGRPILIGTGSVEESDLLAQRLAQAGVSCHVLNAKNDAMEAEMISRAGGWGAVTVSTNMAGRGVDIRLGGDSEHPENYRRVAELGGLYVIGTNLHESIRVDNQLRGRAGRQGDPGSSRFFVSLEDDLIVRFGIREAIPAEYLNIKQTEPLEVPAILKNIAHIQQVINGQNYDIRKTLNKYADLVEQQRRIIYARRQDVLNDRIPLTLLASQEAGRFRHVCQRFGERTMREVEKRITLYQIDHCWADYLDYVGYIKEGIHLESIGKRNPLDEFHRQIIAAFEHLPSQIEEAVLKTFREAEITSEGIDLDRQGVKIPSATWTYIVNDSFFQNRVTLF